MQSLGVIVNIDLIIGHRVAPCIAHDAPFASSPLWVRYESGPRQLSIVFDDGQSRPLRTPVNDQMAGQLQWARKIMLVRLHEGRPVEGFECHLRKFDEAGHELATA
jgi:hypothetical protein